MSRYKKISTNIHQVTIDNPQTPGGEVVWLNITNPGKKEIQYLRKSRKYDFSLSHLQASSVKATSQRPLVEQSDDYLFLILHFPILKDGIVASAEVEFFIGENYLVTLHKNNKVLKSFFSLCKKDGESLLSTKHESTSVLLYEILEKLMLSCYPLIDKNSLKISGVEELIFDQESKTAVARILELRRNTINTRKIMQNHKNIIKKLIQVEIDKKHNGEVKKYYLQLLELSKRIWESLENQKEMIDVLDSTNESLLNYRISDIMKTLTIFSVIVFPLTLFAALFGMNTMGGMPLVKSAYGFWIIIGIMLFGCLGMLIFFKRKRWI